MAKAIGDLEDQIAKAHAARRCDSCGRYQTHEQLKTVPTDDGDTQRLCSDCLDDDPAAKALYRQSWADALEKMDEAIAKSRRLYPLPPMDALSKAQASDRLSKAYDASMAYLRRMAVPPGRKPAADRLSGLVRAEITRRKTAEVVAGTKRNKRKIAKLRRKSDAMEVAKGEAEQMLADLLATQAASTAQLDQLSARVETVYRNAERAYGAVAKQQDARAIAAQAREDQIRADYALAANQTRDPDIRAYYLAKAAGQELEDED